MILFAVQWIDSIELMLGLEKSIRLSPDANIPTTVQYYLEVLVRGERCTVLYTFLGLPRVYKIILPVEKSIRLVTPRTS